MLPQLLGIDVKAAFTGHRSPYDIAELKSLSIIFNFVRVVQKAIPVNAHPTNKHKQSN